MKNIFLIPLFLICVVNSYAQDTKPTKQETMDWIGKTLMKYKNVNSSDGQWGTIEYSNFTYSNGTISYTEKFTSRIDGGSSKMYITINLNKAYSFKINHYHNQYEIVGSNIEKQNYIVDGTEPELSYDNSFEVCFSDCKNQAFNIIEENNIVERLGKAFEALVEFNKKELPKEAY
jgi:hypothetical protein